MSFFEPGSPLMKVLSRIADLVILNLAVMLCCLPVVTAGAALTAMHYVLLRIVRNEEGYILRDYFRSFKSNFVQATLMWFFFLLCSLVFLADLSLTGGGEETLRVPLVFRSLLAAGGVYLFLLILYAFPLLSRFHNTVAGTIRNASHLVLAAFPRTLGMALAALLPPALLAFPPVFPVFLLLGMTGPGFLCALLYDPVFRKIEDSAQGAG